MRRPVRLVRNVDAGELFDTFLVLSVTTVLLTRLYLHFTGYPEVGSATLHIAHLLPGGLLMLVAILVCIGSINRSSRTVAAVLGGIGFGLFWDELGKFITKDNNYFFKPTAGIMYLSFVTLYLLLRYVVRRHYHPEDYLANAVDLALEGTIGELDPREYQRAHDMLELADHNHPMYEAAEQLLEQARPTKAYRPFILQRIGDWLHAPFHFLVQQWWFKRALWALFYIYGLSLIATIVFLAVHGSSKPLLDLLANPGGDPDEVGGISSFISAMYIIWGLVLMHRGRLHDALKRLEVAILINIFVTQVFLFFSYQFTAVLALLGALVLLVIVRVLSSETRA